MPKVFENIDPEVSAIVLDPLLAQPNITEAVYSKQNKTLTVTGSGEIPQTLNSVLLYRMDQLARIQHSFNAALDARRADAATSAD
jgi:hypothetical protein